MARFERAALHQEDIQVSVVVVVEQRDARSTDLGLIEPAGHAVDVHEGETGRFGTVDEPLGCSLWRGGGMCCGCLLGWLTTTSAASGEEGQQPRRGEQGS